MKGRPLPIGIDDFAKLREGGYYYVDKTAFIGELWRNRGEVNLFTRPRRFGKTLNMSMLQYFLRIRGMRRRMKGTAVFLRGWQSWRMGLRFLARWAAGL